MTGEHGQDLDLLNCGLDKVGQPLSSFLGVQSGPQLWLLRGDTVGTVAFVAGHAGPTTHGDLGGGAKAHTIGSHSQGLDGIQSVADATQGEELYLAM